MIKLVRVPRGCEKNWAWFLIAQYYMSYTFHDWNRERDLFVMLRYQYNHINFFWLPSYQVTYFCATNFQIQFLDWLKYFSGSTFAVLFIFSLLVLVLKTALKHLKFVYLRCCQCLAKTACLKIYQIEQLHIDVSNWDQSPHLFAVFKVFVYQNMDGLSQWIRKI